MSQFRLECPSQESAIAVLANAFDLQQAQGFWEEACQQAGMSFSQVNSEEELAAVLHQLSLMKGTVSVYGLSLKIRLIAYQNMQRLQVSGTSMIDHLN